ERESHDGNDSEAGRFEELAKSEFEVIHIIRSATPRLDRHVMHGERAISTRATQPRRELSQQSQAQTDCRARFDRVALLANALVQLLRPDRQQVLLQLVSSTALRSVAEHLLSGRQEPF